MKTLMDIHTVFNKKSQGQKITMLTAYDYSMGMLLDKAEIDVILVGDSLANVVLGLESTTQVGMVEMLYHAQAVLRGVKRSAVIVDMPYEAYQLRGVDFLSNARCLMDTGCSAVKVEWFVHCLDVVRTLVKAGIPVVGHIGLTPQTAEQLGGFRVQGKDPVSAACIKDQSNALEREGCLAVVLECVPEQLAADITQALTIPTIGIGAGRYCDGQILVLNDILGLYDRKPSKFVKQYADIGTAIVDAVKKYKTEVEAETFPGVEHTYFGTQT